ncbi:MAG: FAD-dependent oxidoreductase, partial [Pseudomonadota bacterium]
GCFCNATGRRTILVTRDRVLSLLPDHECRHYVLTMMAEQGIEIREQSELTGVLANENGQVQAALVRTPQGECRIDTDFIFLGLGEVPNSELPIQRLGVEADPSGFIKVNARMQTSVANVYAVGDVVGAPMEMFKARKGGMYAARNIMGEDAEYEFDDYPDFLHSHYEVSWFGMGEEQARENFPSVNAIKMPPDNPDGWNIALPASDRTMLYAMKYPRMSGFQKLVVNGENRRILGAFHVGYGAKDGFQYLYQMAKRGVTVDQLGEMDELFLNPSHFIQLCRLRAGSKELRDL